MGLLKCVSMFSRMLRRLTVPVLIHIFIWLGFRLQLFSPKKIWTIMLSGRTQIKNRTETRQTDLHLASELTLGSSS